MRTPKSSTADAVAQAHQQRHMVLNDHHGEPVALAQLLNQRAQPLLLGGIESGSGLIEQQQGRVGAQGPRHFQAPAIAIGQGPRLAIGQGRESQLFQQLPGRFAALPFGLAVACGAEQTIDAAAAACGAPAPPAGCRAPSRSSNSRRF
jgi:hypothetical protein